VRAARPGTAGLLAPNHGAQDTSYVNTKQICHSEDHKYIQNQPLKIILFF
jgi:hypothetical protein